MSKNNIYIKSPLNYTGGKYKILDKIMPCFPREINTFIDIFGGGFNVGINVEAQKIIYNDHIYYLSQMFEYFKNEVDIFEKINARILEFDLDITNQQGYINLRNEYNKSKKPLDLFLLTCYSFNHQIRFNNKREFNTPFGKNRSAYNSSIESNLREFIEKLKLKNVEFYSQDFLYFKNYNFTENDFVYCDPPYLISNAAYNDGKRGFKNWTEKEEEELLNFLDWLNEKNVKFLLSNVLVHKGLENSKLIEWSKKYNLKNIDKDYKNCSYQLKGKIHQTKEVVIYNY